MINVGWILSVAALALILLVAIVILIKTGWADRVDMDSSKLTILAGKMVIAVIILVAAATVAAWITLVSD